MGENEYRRPDFTHGFEYYVRGMWSKIAKETRAT